MTLRERIMAVYRGEIPDVVPFMLDLSHWFYHARRRPWDLSQSLDAPDKELIDYHKAAGAGFYIPNLGSFFSTSFSADVKASSSKRMRGGVPEITWRLETPVGAIQRSRIWEEQTYAWGISEWGVHNERDLNVFRYAMSRRQFAPLWDRYAAWDACVGDAGIVCVPVGYSAMGHLLNYWMGPEQVAYATMDYPALMHETVDAVNANLLDLVDILCDSPVEVVMMGDNFSSDLQPPDFFSAWSKPFYVEAIRRLHGAGKFVTVHIDGRLRRALAMIRDTGADGADAVTPAPMGDLSPAECRAEAGPAFILSGGVSPDLWLPRTPIAVFEAKVLEWLALRSESPRLIAAAGDQVPPGADKRRIAVMRDLVEKHGRY